MKNEGTIRYYPAFGATCVRCGKAAKFRFHAKTSSGKTTAAAICAEHCQTRFCSIASARRSGIRDTARDPTACNFGASSIPTAAHLTCMRVTPSAAANRARHKGNRPRDLDGGSHLMSAACSSLWIDDATARLLADFTFAAPPQKPCL